MSARRLSPAIELMRAPQAVKGGNIFFFEDPTAAAVKSFFDEPPKSFQETAVQPSPQEAAAKRASRHENNPFYLPEGDM